MDEVKLIITKNRFKSYREVDKFKKYINEFKERINPYSKLVDIIDSYEFEEKEKLLNKIFYLSKCKSFKNKFLSDYPEFEKYNNIDFIDNVLKASEYYEDMKRYEVMFLIYNYIILDECLSDITKNALHKPTNDYIGVMPKIKIIKDNNICIDPDKELRLSVFSQIRNDFVHGNGVFSLASSDKISRFQYKDPDYIKRRFGLVIGEPIKLSFGKINEFFDISNEILKDISNEILDE